MRKRREIKNELRLPCCCCCDSPTPSLFLPTDFQKKKKRGIIFMSNMSHESTTNKVIFTIIRPRSKCLLFCWVSPPPFFCLSLFFFLSGWERFDSFLIEISDFILFIYFFVLRGILFKFFRSGWCFGREMAGGKRRWGGKRARAVWMGNAQSGRRW